MAQNPTQFMAALNPRPFVTRYRTTIKYGAIAVVGIAVVSWGYAVLNGSSRARTNAVQMVSSAREMPWPDPSPKPPQPQQVIVYQQPQQQSQPQPKAAPQESEETKRRRAALRRAKNASARVGGFSFGEEGAVVQVSQQSQGAEHSAQGNGNALEIPPVYAQGPGRNGGFSRGNGLTHSRDEQYLDARPMPPRTRYTLRSGAVIPLQLKWALDSDREGSAVAMVTQDVMDSGTGQVVVVPAGSEVFGWTDANFQGQAYLNFAARTLTFPNEWSLPLHEMPGGERDGRRGVRDRVNSHFLQRYGSAFLLSMATAGIRLGTYSHGGGGFYYTPQDAAVNGLSQEMGQVARQDLQNRLRIPPTVTVPEGYRFNLQVVQDISFDQPYPFTQVAQMG